MYRKNINEHNITNYEKRILLIKTTTLYYSIINLPTQYPTDIFNETV